MAPRPIMMRALVTVAIMAATAASIIAPASVSATAPHAAAVLWTAPTLRQCLPCGGTIRGRCMAGTVCARSNEGVLSCVKPMRLGHKCTDPCWACTAGLKCGARGVCVTAAPVVKRQCQPCGNGRGGCAAGTVCGRNWIKLPTCVKYVPAGRKCWSMCWACAKGLTCGRTGVCEPPAPPAIRQCLPCGGTIRGRCTAGTVCARSNEGVLSCVKPMRLGHKCTDPCWACTAGLKCGARGVCEAAKPAPNRHCQLCGGTRGGCAAGTVCGRSWINVPSCVKHVPIGHKCWSFCWACAKGLKCGARGVCEAAAPPAIRQCLPCGGTIRGRCTAGTVCAKSNEGVLSCVKPMRLGHKCTDPCWACAKGLTCGRTGRCQQAWAHYR